MTVTQLYSSDYITVEYDADAQLIHHTVHKPMGVPQIAIYKDALNAGTEALQHYGISKWLSDDRNNGPLPDELESWGTQDWIPRTLNAGWKYWANVVPVEVHAAETLVPAIEALHQYGLRMQVFTNLEEAYEWLASKE